MASQHNPQSASHRQPANAFHPPHEERCRPTPDVKNLQQFEVTCGICGRGMTPENSRFHPEFFVCDQCCPAHVCAHLGCEHDIEEVAGEPAVSHNRGDAPATAPRLSGNAVSRGHGAQGDPATAATLGHALAFETAAGIPLEALAEFNDEGETGRNAAGRALIARKMQRIAAGGPNHYSHDEHVGIVIRAERGELR